jgi:hypothetical protein
MKSSDGNQLLDEFTIDTDSLKETYRYLLLSIVQKVFQIVFMQHKPNEQVCYIFYSYGWGKISIEICNVTGKL